MTDKNAGRCAYNAHNYRTQHLLLALVDTHKQVYKHTHYHRHTHKLNKSFIYVKNSGVDFLLQYECDVNYEYSNYHGTYSNKDNQKNQSRTLNMFWDSSKYCGLRIANLLSQSIQESKSWFQQNKSRLDSLKWHHLRNDINIAQGCCI